MNKNNTSKLANKLVPVAIKRTDMGGVTFPLALRVRNSIIDTVRPIARRYSRSGSHGFVYYHSDDIDILALLLQSNSGYRSVIMRYCSLSDEACKKIYDILYDLWVSLRAPYIDVVRAIKLVKI